MRPSNRSLEFDGNIIDREFATLESHEEIFAIQAGAHELAKSDPAESGYEELAHHLEASKYRELADFNPIEGPTPPQKDPNPRVGLYESQRESVINSLEATASLGGLRGYLLKRKGASRLATMMLQQLESDDYRPKE